MPVRRPLVRRNPNEFSPLAGDDMLPIGPAVAVVGGVIDFSKGRVQTLTVTGALTLSCTGFAAAPEVNVVRLYLVNAGAFALGLPSNWEYRGKAKPTFTASGKDVVVLTSFDGGASVDVSYELNKGTAT